MPERLIAEVKDLSQKVGDLATHVSVSQSQAEKTRRLTLLSMALAGLCVLLTIAAVAGGVVAWNLSADNERAVDRIEEAVGQIEEVQVTTCQNANASRVVHHDFWIYLLNISRQNPENQIPVILEFFNEFEATIDEAFGKRSCARENLNRKYPAPEFPEIPTRAEIEKSAESQG